jgi:hypothetical protein
VAHGVQAASAATHAVQGRLQAACVQHRTQHLLLWAEPASKAQAGAHAVLLQLQRQRPDSPRLQLVGGVQATQPGTHAPAQALLLQQQLQQRGRLVVAGRAQGWGQALRRHGAQRYCRRHSSLVLQLLLLLLLVGSEDCCRRRHCRRRRCRAPMAASVRCSAQQGCQRCCCAAAVRAQRQAGGWQMASLAQGGALQRCQGGVAAGQPWSDALLLLLHQGQHELLLLQQLQQRQGVCVAGVGPGPRTLLRPQAHHLRQRGRAPQSRAGGCCCLQAVGRIRGVLRAPAGACGLLWVVPRALRGGQERRVSRRQPACAGSVCCGVRRLCAKRGRCWQQLLVNHELLLRVVVLVLVLVLVLVKRGGWGAVASHACNRRAAQQQRLLLLVPQQRLLLLVPQQRLCPRPARAGRQPALCAAAVVVEARRAVAAVDAAQSLLHVGSTRAPRTPAGSRGAAPQRDGGGW